MIQGGRLPVAGDLKVPPPPLSRRTSGLEDERMAYPRLYLARAFCLTTIRRLSVLILALVACAVLLSSRADDFRIGRAGLDLLRAHRRPAALAVEEVFEPPPPPVGEVAMLSCWSGDLTANGKQSVAAKHEYAEYWNYTLHVSVNEPMDEGKDGSWNKIFALRRLFKEHPETEWFWFSDADLLIMNPALSIEEHILAPLDLIPGETNDTSTFLIIASDCNCLNAGSFLIRNNAEGWLFLDLLLDPLLHDMPYAEQDSMSHLFSYHKTLLEGVALVPLRMLNAYPPSSCPVAQVAYDPANGEWNYELTSRTLVLPGYEYGSVDNLGWNAPPPPSNWVPRPAKVQVVDEQGEEIEVRELTADEMMQDYKDIVEAKGLEFDPLLLRTDGTPPSTAPGTEFSVDGVLTSEEEKRVAWQWWNDKRLYNGQWHYQAGDLGIHLAGCWLVEGNCEKTWKHYFDRRGSVADLPPREPGASRYNASSPSTLPRLGGLHVNKKPTLMRHGGVHKPGNGTKTGQTRLETQKTSLDKRRR